MSIEKNSITDDKIREMSQNRVLIDYRDIELDRGEKYFKSIIAPFPGGVYDSNYFGSVYHNTCNCGKTDTIGSTCQFCSCKVISEREKYQRYARIELDFYYVMGTKIDGLITLLKSIPLNYKDAISEFDKARLSRGSVFLLCELSQFNWDEEKEEVVLTLDITDESKASYEGLELILKEHFPEQLHLFNLVVNKTLIVAPAVYRNIQFTPFEFRTNIVIPYLTAIYQSVIYLKQLIRDKLPSMEDAAERTVFKASFRRYLSRIPEEVSEALLPSKENVFRNAYSARVDESGRAPIVGDPNLKVDECLLPFSLAYELLKVAFIAHLSVEHDMTTSKAELTYRRASLDTLELFEKYAKTRRVMLNRPPTLHRYNILSFKIGLTQDNAIHYPITAVGPMSADYDGKRLQLLSA